MTRYGFARWLASFTDLAGIVEIHEDGSRAKQRIRSEVRRIGWLRFIFDVIPYRIYSRFVDQEKDKQWEDDQMAKLGEAFLDIPESTSVLVTHSPNSDEAREFINSFSPDMVIARCKTLLKKDIYSIAKDGTFVLHPGICPEYRNAHGCFWALANNEPDKVGMTLLKIDDGIDTGPVYGYYSYPFDVAKETIGIIYNRVVYDNLDVLREKFIEIHNNKAALLDTSGRKSGIWGQPWLSRYLKIRKQGKLNG
jgi:folate-dependent phosphoribosylglycinamide formyltransferase PurN